MRCSTAILATRDDLSPELVQWASPATQVKFALYAAMLAMLLAVGARALWRQRARGALTFLRKPIPCLSRSPATS